MKKIDIKREPIMFWATETKQTTACQITLGELKDLPGITDNSKITIGEDERTRLTEISWTVYRRETQKEMERRIRREEWKIEQIETMYKKSKLNQIG